MDGWPNRVSGTYLYSWAERDTVIVRVSRTRTQQLDPSQVQTWTAPPGVSAITMTTPHLPGMVCIMPP